MSDVLDWFGRLTVYGWFDLGTNIIFIALAVALIRDYEQLHKRVTKLEPAEIEHPATQPIPAAARSRHSSPQRARRGAQPTFGDVYADADD